MGQIKFNILLAGYTPQPGFAFIFIIEAERTRFNTQIVGQDKSQYSPGADEPVFVLLIPETIRPYYLVFREAFLRSSILFSCRSRTARQMCIFSLERTRQGGCVFHRGFIFSTRICGLYHLTCGHSSLSGKVAASRRLNCRPGQY